MIRRQRGFTLIELLVVIAIILILAAILFPVFAKVRAKALQTACLNNLNQMGKACEMYQGAWGDVCVPFGAPFEYRDLNQNPPRPGGHWPILINPYLRQIERGYITATSLGKIFRCPAALEEETTGWAFQRSYGMNEALGGWYRGGTPVVVPVSQAKYPSQTIRIAETEWQAQGGSFMAARPEVYDPNEPTGWRFAPRHNDVGEILWVDGHVSTMNMERYILRDGGAYRGQVWLRLEGPKPQP